MKYLAVCENQQNNNKFKVPVHYSVQTLMIKTARFGYSHLHHAVPGELSYQNFG
jgi:hypothetical protein